MKAAYLTGLRKLEIMQAEKPTPQKNEVLVRIKSIGICGSDVHFYKDGKIGTAKATYPYIIGHECSGLIEEAGEGTDKELIGKRVFIEPAIFCHECKYCKRGQHNICPNVGFLGTPPVLGAYAEYMTMPAGNVVLLPDSVTYDEGAMLEPITIGLHGIERIGRKRIDSAESIAVFGCGPIGLTIISILKTITDAPVFAIDKLDYRLEKAKEIGAAYVCNAEKKDCIEYIAEKTGLGVDIAIEAAGDKDAIYNAAEASAPGGIVLITGIPETDNIIIDAHTTRRKELDIKLHRRSNSNDKEAVRFLLDNRDTVNSLISHRMALDDIERGFEMVSEYRDNVIKVILNP